MITKRVLLGLLCWASVLSGAESFVVEKKKKSSDAEIIEAMEQNLFTIEKTTTAIIEAVAGIQKQVQQKIELLLNNKRVSKNIPRYAQKVEEAQALLQQCQEMIKQALSCLSS